MHTGRFPVQLVTTPGTKMRVEVWVPSSPRAPFVMRWLGRWRGARVGRGGVSAETHPPSADHRRALREAFDAEVARLRAETPPAALRSAVVTQPQRESPMLPKLTFPSGAEHDGAAMLAAMESQLDDWEKPAFNLGVRCAIHAAHRVLKERGRWPAGA